MWRPEDEVLLARLENEQTLAALLRHHAGLAADRVTVHPRTTGLVEIVRTLPGGEEAVRDIRQLVRFLEATPLRARPPALLHHLALYYGGIGNALADTAPGVAANAWMRALAAWLALADEASYLTALTLAVLGKDAAKAGVAMPPSRVPLELVNELGKRAVGAARGLSDEGRAALLALAWMPEAARLAGVDGKLAVETAGRLRNAALDAALAVIGEALDEANVRGELAESGPSILAKALAVWNWSGIDVAVEQFVAERLAPIAWEMYRRRTFAALRAMIEPFRPMAESLAVRIQTDPSQIAYAAACAQLFVFDSDVAGDKTRQKELLERALLICPTHRNARSSLASVLVSEAHHMMEAEERWVLRSYGLPEKQIRELERLITRAEILYPQTRDLDDTKAAFREYRKKRGV